MALSESLRDDSNLENTWVSWQSTNQAYTGHIDANGKKDGKGIFYENENSVTIGGWSGD